MLETVDWNWYLERCSRHEWFMHAIKENVYQKKTHYQKVVIVDLHYSGRCLVIDGDLQSSQIDEFIYHEALAHPPMILCDNPKDVFILGGGEGATLREVLKYKSVRTAVMADIDRELVEICAEYLPQWSDGVFEDNRSELVFADARRWIEESNRKFDVIIHDLTIPRPDSPSRKLFSKEFFQLIKSRMKPGGVLSMQASRADFNNMELFCVIKNTLKSVFKNVVPISTYIPSFYSEWGFIMASDDSNLLDLGREEIDRRIAGRINGNLKFFNGETKENLCSFPVCSRKMMDRINGIITDENFPVEEIDSNGIGSYT